MTEIGRSPSSVPSPVSFRYGIGRTGCSGEASISITGSPLTGSVSRFPLSISAFSRSLFVRNRISTVVKHAFRLRIDSSVRIPRGSTDAAAADASAARSGTVPIIVPSAVTEPPNNSVSIIAVPPVSAAESSRNGIAASTEPLRRNRGSETSRKHGSFRNGVRSTGKTNSDRNAYTAPTALAPSVGRMRIRTPSHAAVSINTQKFISVLSSRNGSIASFMRPE